MYGWLIQSTFDYPVLQYAMTALNFIAVNSFLYLTFISAELHAFSQDGVLQVTMTEMYNFGEWGRWDMCNTGSYAAGTQLEVRCS